MDYTFIAMRVKNGRVEYLADTIYRRRNRVRLWTTNSKKIKHLTIEEVYGILEVVKDAIIQRIDS